METDNNSCGPLRESLSSIKNYDIVLLMEILIKNRKILLIKLKKLIQI